MKRLKKGAALPILAAAGLCAVLAADITETNDVPHIATDEVDAALDAGYLRPSLTGSSQLRRWGGVQQIGGGSNVLWNNGEFNGGDPADLGLITNHGTAPGGADSSVIGAPATIFGGSFTRTAAGPNWARADDFTVGDGGWTVDSITVYGYVTDGNVAGNPFGSATFTLNIWAGTPGFGSIIASTTTVNTPTFTNIYRQSATGFPANVQRGIFAIEMVFPGGLELDPGTHWFDVQAVGPPATAWMPPATTVNAQGAPITPLGNSLILQADGTWLPGVSGPAGQEQGYDLPFLVRGVAAPSTCAPDFTGDGAVDTSDLLQLLSAWGACPGCPEDLTGDNVVDTSDLLQLLSAWGACPPGGGPDPTGACCHPDFTCTEGMTEDDCIAGGGTYGGDFNPCEICPEPDEGQSCSQALPIEIGQTVQSTTVGNGIPQPPLCGGLVPDGPTTWFKVVGDGTSLTASVCTGSGQSAIVVFCRDCDTLTCNGGGSSNNEDPECGNPFDGEVTWCAADERDYFIAVWRGDAPGPVSVKVTSSGNPCSSSVDCGQLLDPVCTLPTANCQERSGGTYVVSDAGSGAAGLKVADDFRADVTGSVTSLCWQGVELAPGFSVCSNNLGQGLQFSVTYYADNGGLPGAVIGGPFVGNPQFARINFINFAFGPAGLIDYTMSHAPVSVAAGGCYWVEVVQFNGTCTFLWAPSNQGNLLSYQSPGDVPYAFTHARTPENTTNPDRMFCVSIDTADPCEVEILGACCVDGACSITAPDDCAGCFTLGGTCTGSTCVQDDYFYDCNLPITGIGNDDPAVQWLWVHRFDVQPGMETINEILTGYAADVQQGATVGWAIWDSATVPNSTAPVATGTTTANVGGVQTIAIPATTITSGQFWIGVWTDGPFPMPGNALPPVPGNTWFMGSAAGIDPSAVTLTDITTTTLSYVWLLRANAQ